MTLSTVLGDARSSAAKPQENALPPFCAVCGAAWTRGFLACVSELRLSADTLHRAVETGRLHLLSAPGNQLWICEQSLEYLKENL